MLKRPDMEPYPDAKGEPYSAVCKFEMAKHPGITPAAKSSVSTTRVLKLEEEYVNMNTARMSASGTRFGLVIMAAELARPAMTAAERRGTTVSAIATSHQAVTGTSLMGSFN